MKFPYVSHTTTRLLLESDDPSTFIQDDMQGALDEVTRATADDADNMNIPQSVYWARVAARRKIEMAFNQKDPFSFHMALREFWGT